MTTLYQTTMDPRRYANAANVHADVPLANLATANFALGMEDFIADQLFPAIPVAKQSDMYYTLTKNAFLRVPDALRAPKTIAKKVEFEVGSNNYFAPNYALGAENALEHLANTDMAIRLRDNSVNLILRNLRAAQEVRVANIVTSATNLGSGAVLTGAAGLRKWNDYVNSDPIAAVNTGHAFIRNNTGLQANVAMIDIDTLVTLRRHPIFLDMYKYTQGGQVTVAQIAEAFSVSKIIVGQGIKENALEGGTSSITTIWGNNVLLARVTPPTGMQTATLGLRFQWQPEGFPAAFAVDRQQFRGPGTKNVEVLEAGHFQTEKLIGSELGYLIANTL